MKPRAVILDFDGVMVDSLACHLAAWDEAVREIFGRPLENPQSLTGHATRTIAAILCKRLGAREAASALVAAKHRHLMRQLPPLLPGSREIIDALKMRKIPFGIASNSPRAFVVAAVAEARLDITTVVCGEDVARGKPRPDIFWECANRLDVDPADRSRILVFEDSPHGIRAAVAAGMFPVGIETELSAEHLLEAGAARTCANLAEALAAGWLEQLPG